MNVKKIYQVMLIRDKLFILFLGIILFGCSSQETKKADKKKQTEKIEKQIIDFSKGTIGRDTYIKIRENIEDSLENWGKNNLKAFLAIKLYPYQLDSILCFNKSTDKLVTTLLLQCNLAQYTQDDIWYFYGVKIKEEWYFFSGPTMVIPRDKENIRIPTSFAKLHEIAIDNIFKGYLKQNKESDEWQINDEFFADLTGNAGCADCKTQAQWDSVYLATVRENWKNRDTANYQPLQ